ncbi:MAG TPA: hypothetical protein VI078_10390 [bacterium]
MSARERSALAAEAAFLHGALFGGEIPPEVAERYARAHEAVVGDAPAAQERSVQRIVRRRLDAEAVECVFRAQGRRHLLTTKLQVLCFLVEVRAAYYPRFVNERPGRVRAAAGLVGAALRTAWKRARGRYLIWRHDLA